MRLEVRLVDAARAEEGLVEAVERLAGDRRDAAVDDAVVAVEFVREV
jgi:hypothetical protein